MKIKTNQFLVLSVSILVIICSCQRTDTITNNPVSGFTYTSIGSFPVTVQFVNTSTTPGPASSFKWDFGDGTPYATTTNAVHVYTQAGVYQVKLIQIPPAGAADSVVALVSLSFPPGPSGSSNRVEGVSTASFVFTISSRAYVASFTNTSTDANSYLWKFGDGATSTTDSVTVIHKYNTGGTYHVNLSATNGSGTDTSGTTIVF